MNSAVTAGGGVPDFFAPPFFLFLLFDAAPTAVVPKTLLSVALMPAAMALAAAASRAAAMTPGDMSWVAAAPPASAVTVDELVSAFPGAAAAADVSADEGVGVGSVVALPGARSSARVSSVMSAFTSTM